MELRKSFFINALLSLITLSFLLVFMMHVVRGQENGVDGTKAGGIAGRGAERGRRGRGRGRGGCYFGF